MDVDTEAIQRLTRCPDLWFNDCGLVIRTDDTVFRVSRDFMAAQSPIFRDMLALPTPDNEELYEGCPMVTLPDSKYDVTVFLKALVYHDFFSSNVGDNSSSVLAGVLRLSHKYEVASLLRRAVVHISTLFPTTLAGWQLEVRHENQSVWESLVTGSDAIVLARQLSMDWLLPFAFYQACRGTRELYMLDPDTKIARDDVYRWVLGCRILPDEVSKMLSFLWDPIEECEFIQDDLPESTPCVIHRLSARRKAERSRTFSTTDSLRGPLDIWVDRHWINMTGKVCSSCLTEMKERHARAQQDFWARLPAIFNLPSWDELEKLKATALAA
ncbi:BTB domain-containing protein [Mycena chlorophos]|uniref:BTB domain-containing protein n=1 Tax=Mycena chlorophos TaxID=658473 RepID=A0A8H6SUG6_MYCCL|nr:BTB domain-containing protein [Mycena chlorophos]